MRKLGVCPRTSRRTVTEMATEKNICKNCFYDNRSDPSVTCDHDEVEGGGRVYVKWNDQDQRLETTESSVRPLPQNLLEKVKKYVAMCTPQACRCKRDNCTFAHSRAEQRTWNRILGRGIDPDRSQDLPSTGHLYKLSMQTYRQAEAHPFDSSKDIVKLQGRNNLRGAFDGDTVELEIFDESCDDDDARYGRIKRVVERGGTSNFLCRISVNCPHLLFPIDKKYPLLRYQKYKYDLDSSSEAQNMIFLASLEKWDTEHAFPLVRIVGEYPRAQTIKDSENMLKKMYSIEYSLNNPTDGADHTRRDSSLELFEVFTIDPEGTQNLDDALSMVRLDPDKKDPHQVYQLGVHIVNAAKHIQPDTDLDRVGRKRGTSVYGGARGEIMHMLPDAELRHKLSLTPGVVRDVISVTCNVKCIGTKWEFGECSISQAQIKSAVQLTYEEAQCLIDGPTRVPPNHRAFMEATKLLYSVARSRRQERLESSAAFAYEADDLKEARCWQAHMLVEELMIWANNRVAERVHSQYPNSALLNRQLPPNTSLKESRVEENKKIMRASPFLSQHLPHGEFSVPSTNIKIPLDSLELIRQALAENKTTLLAYLLSEDRLYPQLAAVRSKFRFISRRAEYCCTEGAIQDSSAYRHHSLRLDKYTQFTSPIRRYIDIEVQRMLLEGMKRAALRGNFSHQQHVELCSQLNAKKQNASSFKKKMSNVKLASEYAANSKVCNAFVSQVKKSSMEVTFPDLELRHFPSRDNDFKITNFIYSSKKNGNFMWRLRITTLQDDLAEGLLKLPNQTLSPVNSTKSKIIDTPSVTLPPAKGKFKDTQSVMVAGTKSKYKNSTLSPVTGTKSKFKDTKGVMLTPTKSKFEDARSSTLTPSKFNDTQSKIVAYYCTSESSSLDDECFVLSQPTSFVEISLGSWLKVLEFVVDPTTENMKIVKDLVPPSPSFTKTLSSSLVSTPDERKCPFLQCDVKASINESTILKVWLTGLPGTMREPTISLAIQLVEVSPLLRICMQHNSHPAECFSDLNLTQASRRMYSSLREYVDLWEKVLLAEAAEQSVENCQPLIIREVSLQWPELKCTKDYYIPSGDIKMVLPKDFVDYCFAFFAIGIGDLICLRYGCNSGPRAVYHLVVYQVDRDFPITIAMRSVGKNNCRVSKDMKHVLESGNHTCEMQIIPLGPSYKRVFRGLQKLESGSRRVSELSINVAIGQFEIDLDVNEAIMCQDIVAHDDLATSIWAPKGAGQTKVLNRGQMKAMDLALGKKFQLIQGPPGTGKSVTGAHIAYVFAKLNKTLNTADSHQCVLYCGPSNKSVDVVFEEFSKFLEARESLDVKILRIYSSAVERRDYPGPKLENQYTPTLTKCQAWAKPYALHHMIRDRRRTEPEFRELADLEETLEKTVPSGMICNHYRNVLKKAEEKLLQTTKFDVIFCTCNEASGARVRKNVSPRQCIIDECGMAYEPETIVPIGLCEHAVLIGDHKQLQPVIKYRYASENGLATSLFERYAMNFIGYMFTLKTQYRMHEAICAFPSKEFYGNILETDESVRTRPDTASLDSFWPQGNAFPIMFVDVVGDEGLSNLGSNHGETKVGVDSKFNIGEAKLVIQIAKTLLTEHEVPVENIAILTPYSAQKSKLLDMVKDLPSKFHNIKVASVTESQGDEYEIVILSTVRSRPLREIRNKEHVQPDGMWMGENLGFITDPHQINVGITRSKCGLVITGNKTLLEYDSTWERLLQHYDERGCVVDASRFLP